MRIAEFQRLIEDTYGAKDEERGMEGTFLWFVEEVGELARAMKGSDTENLREEFADVFAWLATLASICNVELGDVVEKYARGCPKCNDTPCICDEPHRFRSAEP
ncbi:MAG TPA: nucleotide pyrophosphohydrolase [Planctomycetes bacterium]|nr:nucleotide pyrophosphohydrolase [Planctomycetota bacterium]